MLICNYSYINQICGHHHSGLTNPMSIIRPHTMRGYFGKAQYESVQDQVKRDGFPTGTNVPYSIIMGDKGALLSSTTFINGTSSQTAGLSMGINCLANLNGTSSISTADLSLITQLATSLSSSGSITVANLVGVVSLASSITSTGSITAGLSLITFMNSVLEGTSSISANLRGTLSMEATIYVNQSEATVQQLVAGVWNAIALDFNTAGTMGAAVNAAGTAGDPWIASLPGAYAPGTAGSILGNLLADMPDAFWDELKTAHTGANSYGKIVQDLETLAKQIKSMTAAGL